MGESTLAPRAPFIGLTATPVARCGVAVCDRDGLGLATVLARKGQTAALAERLRDQCGVDLPLRPQRAVCGDVGFAAIGRGAWLATSETQGNAFAARLKTIVGDLASVVDQSDGYAIVRVAGPKVRETLAKGVFLDLHADVFKPGDAAITSISHIGAVLWRLEEGADGSAAFEIAVFRSLAGSFWRWLTESAGEFGLEKIESGRG